MNDFLLEHFFLKPKRMRALGQTLLYAAFVQFITGMFARVATVSHSLIRNVSVQVVPIPRIADVYPNLWTWWIPETPLGFTTVATFCLVGVLLCLAGSRLERLLAP